MKTKVVCGSNLAYIELEKFVWNNHGRFKNKFEKKTKFRWKCLEKLCQFRRKKQFLTLKNSQNKLSCVRNVFSLNLRNSLYFIGRKKLWNSSTLTWVKKVESVMIQIMTHLNWWLIPPTEMRQKQNWREIKLKWSKKSVVLIIQSGSI